MKKQNKYIYNKALIENILYEERFLNESSLFGGIKDTVKKIMSIRGDQDIQQIAKSKNSVKSFVKKQTGVLNQLSQEVDKATGEKEPKLPQFFDNIDSEDPKSSDMTLVTLADQVDKRTDGNVKISPQEAISLKNSIVGIICAQLGISSAAYASYAIGKYVGHQSDSFKLGNPIIVRFLVTAVIPVVASIIVYYAMLKAVDEYNSLGGKQISVKEWAKEILIDFKTNVFSKINKKVITWAVVSTLLALVAYFLTQKNRLMELTSDKYASMLNWAKKGLRKDDVGGKLNSDVDKSTGFIGGSLVGQVAKDKIITPVTNFVNNDTQSDVLHRDVDGKGNVIVVAGKVILLSFIALTIIYSITEVIDQFNRKKLTEKIKEDVFSDDE